MPAFRFQPTSSWKHDFRRIEMDFFKIPAGQWQAAVNQSPNQLRPNYSAPVHKLHVDVLNKVLPLGDKLDVGDFDGDTSLANLRDGVIGPRIAVAEVSVNIELPPGTSAANLGMEHLL